MMLHMWTAARVWRVIRLQDETKNVMHGGGRESKERMMIKNEERPRPQISVFSEPLGEGKGYECSLSTETTNHTVEFGKEEKG